MLRNCFLACRDARIGRHFWGRHLLLLVWVRVSDPDRPSDARLAVHLILAKGCAGPNFLNYTKNTELTADAFAPYSLVETGNPKLGTLTRPCKNSGIMPLTYPSM